MSNFEHDLRDALKRTNPPLGFAGRIMARTREIDERNEARSGSHWFWRWAAAAVTAVVLAGSLWVYQEHRREVEAEKSKEQLMLALRITGTKLRVIQEKLSIVQQKTSQLPLQQ